MLGAPRGELTARQRAVFGKTVDYVLKHAPCRTLVVASGAGRGMRLYRVAIVVFSVAFVAIGCALLVRTAREGGGVVGFVLGGLFIALGVGRLVIERKRPG